MRTQRLAEHRRTYGARCPRCGKPEDRNIRATWLTLDHVTPLAAGGDLMGPTEVLCLSENVARGNDARRGTRRRAR